MKGMSLLRGIPKIPNHQPKPLAELRYDSEKNIRAIICSLGELSNDRKTHTPQKISHGYLDTRSVNK